MSKHFKSNSDDDQPSGRRGRRLIVKLIFIGVIIFGLWYFWPMISQKLNLNRSVSTDLVMTRPSPGELWQKITDWRWMGAIRDRVDGDWSAGRRERIADYEIGIERWIDSAGVGGWSGLASSTAATATNTFEQIKQNIPGL